VCIGDGGGDIIMDLKEICYEVVNWSGQVKLSVEIWALISSFRLAMNFLDS
jgi:hypothetical protein